MVVKNRRFGNCLDGIDCFIASDQPYSGVLLRSNIVAVFTAVSRSATLEIGCSCNSAQTPAYKKTKRTQSLSDQSRQEENQ